jgi:hypothetical protein
MDAERLKQELDLLKEAYPDLEYRQEGEAHWVRIPRYPLPVGWVYAGQPLSSVEVAFQIPDQIGEGPRRFYVRPAVTLAAGEEIGHYAPSDTCPWGSDFGSFSWHPIEWVPTADVRMGANMVRYARSVAERLGELS